MALAMEHYKFTYFTKKIFQAESGAVKKVMALVMKHRFQSQFLQKVFQVSEEADQWEPNPTGEQRSQEGQTEERKTNVKKTNANDVFMKWKSRARFKVKFYNMNIYGV